MCTSQTIRGSKAWNTLISKHMSKYYVTCLLSILLLSSPGLSPKWRSAGQLTRQVLSSKTPPCLLLNPSENLVYTPTSTSFFHLSLTFKVKFMKVPCKNTHFSMSSKHTFVENNVSDQDYNINQNTSILNSFFPSFMICLHLIISLASLSVTPPSAFHYIYQPSLFSTWYLCLQHPFPNIATISPVHMSTPPQPHLSSFVSKLLYPITKAL